MCLSFYLILYKTSPLKGIVAIEIIAHLKADNSQAFQSLVINTVTPDTMIIKNAIPVKQERQALQ